ncbi:MAG: hypothetical protein GF315_07095 [candidate division Zixibacteria bacterium]|nr:hypothetical protein [candidate division Zixibacteria bacterium]
MVRKYRNILIVRTDAIGDLLLSEPVAQALKAKYPECRITYMASDYAAPVLQGNPSIDSVTEFAKSDLTMSTANVKKAVGKIKAESFDAAVVLRPTWFNAAVIYLSKIPIRVGTAYRAYSVLFNRRIVEHRSKNLRHEMMYNLSMLKPLEISVNECCVDLMPKIYLSEQQSEKAANYLNQIGLIDIANQNLSSGKHAGGGFIIIHPGGRGSAPRWQLTKFFELTELLLERFRHRILFTGVYSEFDGGEAVKIKNFAAKWQPRIINLIGKLDLSLFMGVVSRSATVVSNSTGTAHIAAALGVPMVGIYPDNPTFSLRRWKPVGKEEKIKIASDENIEEIPVGEVFENCVKFLN